MIQIRNLWKRYGKINVLSGLNLEAHQGEILVILGRSGVGKSVLLRHIIGLEAPDAGTIDVDGVQITALQKNQIFHAVRNMGMLFQGAALFDSMTIEENVAFYLRQHLKLSKEEIAEKVSDALSMVGLRGVEKKWPSELSGGMKKRAALARLIVYRPKILLYDEPTTGLDPLTAQQINELIVKTQKELQGTSIVVTHDIPSALFIADRLALHQDGQIVHVAKKEEFMNFDNPMVNLVKETYERSR